MAKKLEWCAFCGFERTVVKCWRCDRPVCRDCRVRGVDAYCPDCPPRPPRPKKIIKKEPKPPATIVEKEILRPLRRAAKAASELGNSLLQVEIERAIEMGTALDVQQRKKEKVNEEAKQEAT